MRTVYQRHGQTADGRTSYDCNTANSWARTRELGTARTQQKTSALGKPDADLFIARTDTRHATPANQSDSTQLKAGNFAKDIAKIDPCIAR